MTKTLRHRIALLLVLLAGVASAVAPALGQSAGGDSSAVAINTNDGSSLFKLTFQIRRVTGEVIDNQNAAVAYASCTECQTVAISIQVLLIAGSPTVFTPENLAIALNEQCSLCNTMALAYQFAIGMETKLKFTPEGNRRIAQLRRQLEQLRTSALSIGEIEAEVTKIMDQLSTVLSTELVGVVPDARQPAPAEEPEQERESSETAPTTSEPPPTETPPETTAPSEPTEPTEPTETAPPGETTDSPPPTSTAPAP